MAKKREATSPFVPVEKQPYAVPENWWWVYGQNIMLPMETKKPAGETFYYIDIDAIDNTTQRVSTPKLTLTKKAPSRASRAVNEGDTLFSLVRPYLKIIAYIDKSLKECIASTGFYVCRPNKNIDGRYLYWLMTSSYVVDGLNTFMKGDNSPSIRAGNIEKYPFPLPPLPEQQRIVDRIESLFAKLDEAKEKAQTALDSFEIRKAAMLHKAFSGELTAEWREKNGFSVKDWNQAPLKDCGMWFGGGTPTTSVSEYWDNGDIPWITSKDMKSDQITDTLLHITMEGVNNSSANYCDKPAVLFVMRSGILRRIFPVCMVNMPFTVNQDLKAIIPKDGLLQKYLFWVCTGYEKDIRNSCMKSGTTVESIEAKKLFAYTIPIAPTPEQTEIVRILDDFFAKESQAKEQIEATLAAIDTMKKAILAKAFRGELGTNDPMEEVDLGVLSVCHQGG